MPDYIGLYYPHIAFPNDGWVKLAALYWDKLGRIVPPGYQHHDSDAVERLKGELGFIEDFAPSFYDTYEVGSMFSSLLRLQGRKLVQYYRLRPHFNNGAELEYIYCNTKMAYKLREEMLRLGLITPREQRMRDHYFGEQIGMHPRLAFIYMEALAAQMSSSRQLHPATDIVRDHVAIGDYTLERLAQALLSSDQDPVQPHLVGRVPTAHEVERLLAVIALNSVLPQNIADVPVEKIIQLRKQYRTELTAFQQHIHEFVSSLDTIQDITDPQVLKVHLEVGYERELKPQLDNLKKCLKSLAVEAVLGVFNVRVVLSPLLTSVGAALHLGSLPPVITGTTGIAYSILPVFQKKRAEMQKAIEASPAAYLLYTQENLSPSSLVTQVVRSTRHMLFGV